MRNGGKMRTKANAIISLIVILLAAGVILLVLRQVESESEGNFMSAEEQEFSGYTGKGCLVDNAITFRYGVSRNGSTTWPCLRIEVPFQEGEEEKMIAVGKLIEAMLRNFGIITDKRGRESKRLPDLKRYANVVGHGLGHWAAGTCYGCGNFKWFGGLCEKCDGYCPGCGVKRVRGRMCDECREKGIIS